MTSPSSNGSKPSRAKKARRGRVKDFFFFCGTSLKYLTTVGTFIPTGAGLARALVRPLEEMPSPRRILEIGPGHGAVTRAIAEVLQPGDELVLVEIIPEFAQYLEEWRRKLPANKAKQIRIECADFLEFDDEPFDLVICGAPFNVFPPEIVSGFYDRFHALSKRETIVSSYNYLGTRLLHRNYPGTRRRMLETEQIICGRQTRAELFKKYVWGNVPPLVVHYYSAWALSDETPDIAKAVVKTVTPRVEGESEHVITANIEEEYNSGAEEPEVASVG